MSVRETISMAANLEAARNSGRAAAALEAMERQAAGDRARQQGTDGLRQAVWEAGRIVETGQAMVDQDPESALYHAAKAGRCLVGGVDEREFPDLVDKHFLSRARAARQALEAHARARLHGQAADAITRLVWLESAVPQMQALAGWREARERLAARPSVWRWVGLYLGGVFVGGSLRNAGGVWAVIGWPIYLVGVAAFFVAVVAAFRRRSAASAVQPRVRELGERAGAQPSAGPGRRWDAGDVARMDGEFAGVLARMGADPAGRSAADLARDLATWEREAGTLRGQFPHLRLVAA